MPKHRYELSEDVGLDPGLRDALNANGRLLESELDEIRRGQIDIGTVVSELQGKFDGVYAMLVQTIKTNEKLTEQVTKMVNQVVEEREILRLEKHHAALARLAPMRPPMDTYEGLRELADAARSSQQTIPSDRVEAIVERIKNRDVAKQVDVDHKGKRDLMRQVIAGAIVAAITLTLAILAGHFEGRASAPQPAVRTP